MFLRLGHLPVRNVARDRIVELAEVVLNDDKAVSESELAPAGNEERRSEPFELERLRKELRTSLQAVRLAVVGRDGSAGDNASKLLDRSEKIGRAHV